MCSFNDIILTIKDSWTVCQNAKGKKINSFSYILFLKMGKKLYTIKYSDT